LVFDFSCAGFRRCKAYVAALDANRYVIDGLQMSLSAAAAATPHPAVYSGGAPESTDSCISQPVLRSVTELTAVRRSTSTGSAPKAASATAEVATTSSSTTTSTDQGLEAATTYEDPAIIVKDKPVTKALLNRLKVVRASYTFQIIH
jgi:hypothetical protein